MLAFIFVNKVLLKYSHVPVLTQHCNSKSEQPRQINKNSPDLWKSGFKRQNLTFPPVIWYMALINTEIVSGFHHSAPCTLTDAVQNPHQHWWN